MSRFYDDDEFRAAVEADEYGQWMAEMEAVCKPYRVKCRCGRGDELPETELKAKGWRLSPLYDDTELCPACYAEQVNWEAGVSLGRAQKLNDQIEANEAIGPRKRMTKKQRALLDAIAVPF